MSAHSGRHPGVPLVRFRVRPVRIWPCNGRPEWCVLTSHISTYRFITRRSNIRGCPAGVGQTDAHGRGEGGRQFSRYLPAATIGVPMNVMMPDFE